MSKKFVLLLIAFGVLVGFSDLASALPLIGAVDRSGGASGDRDPIGVYDGERDPEPTQAGGWTNGNYCFSDRTYTWANTPAEIDGAEYIRTYNSDKDERATVKYTVTFPISANVLVAADDRFSGQQGYVDSIVRDFAAAGTFTDTGWDVFVGGDGDPPGRQLSVYSAVLEAGTYVFLGANAGGNNFYVIGALPKPTNPSKPSPPHDAINVPVDANLAWTRGADLLSEEVWFGTDPSALEHVDTITLPNPALYDPGVLIAGRTYYWQIVEVNDVTNTRYEGPVWSFHTIPGEAQLDYPSNHEMIIGDLYPEPPDPPTHIYTTLVFDPGPSAVKHTGYFSEDYSKVAGRDQDANLGPPPYPTWPGLETTYYVGNPYVPPVNDTLVRGTTYYWTVDATDAFGNTFSGDIWDFSIRDVYAFSPSPPNEAILISPDVLLSWSSGYGAEKHDVYMGVSWEDVNNALWQPPAEPPPEYVWTVEEPNYQCSGLARGTKFYWRIDEVIGRTPWSPGIVYKGPVWCFTTIPEFPLDDPNLVGWWKFDMGVGTTAWDWSGHENHGTRIGDPSWVVGMAGYALDFALDFDGVSQYVQVPDSASLGLTKDLTIAAWIRPDDLSGGRGIVTKCEGTSHKQYILTIANGELRFEYELSGNNYSLTGGTITTGEWQHVAVTVDNSLLVTLYVNTAVTASETAEGEVLAQINPVVIGRWSGTYEDRYFDGLIDDARIYNYALSAAEIRTIGVPLEAWDPSPYHGQASVPITTPLKWMPGKYAALHDVYVGTDKAAVESATTADTTGIYKGRVGPNTLDVSLNAAELYYWRVDEVNLAGPDPCMWKGNTWIFRTVGAAGGLLGVYYHWWPERIGEPPPQEPYFRQFVTSQIEPTVDFPRSGHYWATTNDSPDPSVDPNGFVCRWVGQVECPVDANYTFYTQTDDGARIFINGTELVLYRDSDDVANAWRQQGPTWYHTSPIELTAGLYDIEMHMYEHDGGAAARLSWSAVLLNPSDYQVPGLSTSRQIIPPIWLWPPLFASGPQPPNGATIDDRRPALEWIAGINAKYPGGHELYFSDNFDDVNERNPAVQEVLDDPCRPYPDLDPPLQLGKTYYWLVDEVGLSGRWDARTVWSFTIKECLSLDNFDDYNDRGKLREVWRDGNADVIWDCVGDPPICTLVSGGSSGSNLNFSTAVGSPSQGATGPVRPTPLNYDAMALYYDNDGNTYVPIPGGEKWIYDAPYYSEIEANTVGDNSLGVGQSWYAEGVRALTLWFQGHPISDGTYSTTTWPAYPQKGRGRDIWGRWDEFYFLGRYPYTSYGADQGISVQVYRMDDTNDWAKAGVMIREKMTPYSKYAAVFMTPNNGVTFQYREYEDGPSIRITKPGVTTPQWVFLERQATAFKAYHGSPDAWYDVNAPGSAPVSVSISFEDPDPNLYIGTVVTSNDGAELCTADFNNMTITPNPEEPPLSWVRGNVGTNDAGLFYVALEDTLGNVSVVEHDDVNAVTLTSWQEWNIDLMDFTDVDLNAVKKVYIGFGDREFPVKGGKGTIYIDDIRACPPRCVPELVKPSGDIARPYDCTVDEKDVRALAGDWLLMDDFIASITPGTPGAHYKFEKNTNDSGPYLGHGTAYGIPSYVGGRIDSNAIYFDGLDDYVVVQDHPGIEFTGESFSVSLWLKSDYTTNPKEFLVCNGTNGTEFNAGGYNGGPASGKRYVLKFDGGQFRFLIDDDVVKTNCNVAYNNYATGDWVHVTTVCDRDANELRVYRNGLLDNTTSNVTTGDINSPDEPLYIGAKQREGADANSPALAPIDHFFQGPLDDVRIYNYDLSHGEIAYLATEGGIGIHIPIVSGADLYEGEPKGQQWINFKDYAIIADQYLDVLLWPTTP